MDQWGAIESQRIAAVQPHVERAARVHGVDPSLINAVIWVESRFDPRARSSAGALGLMQLMPATAKDLAKRMGEPARPRSPDFNVRAGTYYLARLLKKFGSENLAIAAYNAGPGRVSRLQKSRQPLPDRSVRYVRKVQAARARFRAIARRPAPRL